MKKINIVFDDVLDDVDIICVPEFVANEIARIVQAFFSWMYNNDHEYWVVNAKGQKVLTIETESFIWWLNNHYINSNEQAYIISQHGCFVPNYPTADF